MTDNEYKFYKDNIDELKILLDDSLLLINHTYLIECVHEGAGLALINAPFAIECASFQYEYMDEPRCVWRLSDTRHHFLNNRDVVLELMKRLIQFLMETEILEKSR